MTHLLFSCCSNTLEELAILISVEGERTDVLKTFGVNDIFVVVLKTKVFPDNDVGFSLHQQSYSAAAEVTAFRTDVKRGPTVRQVGSTLPKESIDACFLLVCV